MGLLRKEHAVRTEDSRHLDSLEAFVAVGYQIEGRAKEREPARHVSRFLMLIVWSALRVNHWHSEGAQSGFCDPNVRRPTLGRNGDGSPNSQR